MNLFLAKKYVKAKVKVGPTKMLGPFPSPALDTAMREIDAWLLLLVKSGAKIELGF